MEAALKEVFNVHRNVVRGLRLEVKKLETRNKELEEWLQGRYGDVEETVVYLLTKVKALRLLNPAIRCETCGCPDHLFQMKVQFFFEQSLFSLEEILRTLNTQKQELASQRSSSAAQISSQSFEVAETSTACDGGPIRGVSQSTGDKTIGPQQQTSGRGLSQSRVYGTAQSAASRMAVSPQQTTPKSRVRGASQSSGSRIARQKQQTNGSVCGTPPKSRGRKASQTASSRMAEPPQQTDTAGAHKLRLALKPNKRRRYSPAETGVEQETASGENKRRLESGTASAGGGVQVSPVTGGGQVVCAVAGGQRKSPATGGGRGAPPVCLVSDTCPTTPQSKRRTSLHLNNTHTFVVPETLGMEPYLDSEISDEEDCQLDIVASDEDSHMHTVASGEGSPQDPLTDEEMFGKPVPKKACSVAPSHGEPSQGKRKSSTAHSVAPSYKEPSHGQPKSKTARSVVPSCDETSRGQSKSKSTRSVPPSSSQGSAVTNSLIFASTRPTTNPARCIPAPSKDATPHVAPSCKEEDATDSVVFAGTRPATSKFCSEGATDSVVFAGTRPATSKFSSEGVTDSLVFASTRPTSILRTPAPGDATSPSVSMLDDPPVSASPVFSGHRLVDRSPSGRRSSIQSPTLFDDLPEPEDQPALLDQRHKTHSAGSDTTPLRGVQDADDTINPALLAMHAEKHDGCADAHRDLPSPSQLNASMDPALQLTMHTLGTQQNYDEDEEPKDSEMEWPVSLQRLHANEGQDITGISLSGLSSSTCSSQHTQQQQLMPATLNDTFDRVPAKKPEKFAYNQVVRKQDERRKLAAYSCPQCSKYFSAAGLTEAEIAERMAQCSRHRAVMAPPATPPHFWSLGFPDTHEWQQTGC